MTSEPNALASLQAPGSLALVSEERIDLDQLDHWLRIGWRRRGASVPYPDSEDEAPDLAE
jgi:hypothetical protein